MDIVDAHESTGLAQVNELLRVAHEIGSAIFNARAEGPLLTYVIGRLAEALGMDDGAIFLYDGHGLSVAASVGGAGDHPSSLVQVGQMADRLLRGDNQDAYVFTNAEAMRSLLAAEDAANAETLAQLRSLIMLPLPTHGAPMGVLLLGGAQDRHLQPAEVDTLRLLAKLLATSMRGMRLQAKVEKANRLLAEHGEEVNPANAMDPLTNLFNREYITEQTTRIAGEAIQTGGQLSLLFVDIDHFQEIRSSYGEEFSNGVLCRVAEVIQRSIRGRDMAARYDGDQFAVLLPSTPGLGAVVVAERLLERISGLTFNNTDGAWQVSISIGVGALSTRVISVDALLGESERCLLQAKHLGGNQIMFEWDDALEAVEE